MAIAMLRTSVRLKIANTAHAIRPWDGLRSHWSALVHRDQDAGTVCWMSV